MKFVTHEDFFNGRLKLRHLVVALAVAEEGSTVAAATRLFVSQPAITRLILELEGILEAPLFERTPTGMRPTPYAEPFLEHARSALSHIKHAAHHVQELTEGTTGVVTVGVHLAGSSLLLPRAIASLKRDKPRVDVIVRERSPQDLFADLGLGEVDLLLTRLVGENAPAGTRGERLLHEPLYEEPMVPICSMQSEWAGARSAALADLAEESWVLPVRTTVLRSELEQAFARQGLRPPPHAVECTSVITVMALVAEANYLAVVPHTLVDSLPNICTLNVPDLAIRSSVGVVRAADHAPSPATATFLDHLRSTARML